MAPKFALGLALHRPRRERAVGPIYSRESRDMIGMYFSYMNPLVHNAVLYSPFPFTGLHSFATVVAVTAVGSWCVVFIQPSKFVASEASQANNQKFVQYSNRVSLHVM